MKNRLLEAKCQIALGEEEKGFNQLVDIAELLGKKENTLFLFFTWKELFEAAVLINRRETAKIALEHLYEIAKKIEVPVKWIEYYQCIIKYAKSIDERELLKEGYSGFYLWSKRRDKILSDNLLAKLDDKINLYELEIEKEIIENRNDILKNMAEVDELTQIGNRRWLEKYLRKMYEKANSERQNLCVMIFDVDFFKEYNDKYGHIEGDKCLKSVADAIKASSDKECLIGRYGGDEFVLVSIGKKKLEVEKLIENIRENIDNLKILNEESKVAKYVTLSIGAINMMPDCNKNVEYYFEYADKELYKVKRNGKNGYSLLDEMN